MMRLTYFLLIFFFPFLSHNAALVNQDRISYGRGKTSFILNTIKDIALPRTVSIHNIRRSYHKAVTSLYTDVFFNNETYISLRRKECSEKLANSKGDPNIKHFVALDLPHNLSTHRVVGFVELSITSEQCNILGSGNNFKSKRPKINTLIVDSSISASNIVIGDKE